MKILVTGSSGLIGSCLFERLRKKHEVFGLDLKRSPYTTITGDIRDYDLVEKVMGGVDAVIHCAAQVSVVKSIEDPLFDAENNVTGTLNLLEAARKSRRLKRFIYLTFSTAEAGRFLHAAPSTLRDTSVSAFISPFTASGLSARAAPPAR